MLLALAVAVSNGGPAGIPAIRAQEPVGAGFQLDAGDLRFIFRQIQIAQNHSAGNPLFGPGPNQVTEPRRPFGLRTIAGAENHVTTRHTGFGAADQIFPRMTAPLFRPAAPLPFDPDGPGPLTAGSPTSYAQTKGIVIDPQPRIATNLIADQTTRNPAAVNAAGEAPEVSESGTLVIPNVAPDVGLSAPFNTMFTFFGQFFDHGLDLLNKGGSGTVMVPLQADDPLIAGPDKAFGTPDDLPEDRRFMVITRGTNLPGPDGVVGDDPATPGIDESADDVHEGTNQTSSFVDQNQTYTSHPSHQVFLREYALNGAGRPVSTGRMIDGAGGHIGSWAEVKQQARLTLGIALTDQDVFNVPRLQTDDYGYFKRGPRGFPQMDMTVGPDAEGTPTAPITTAGAVKTGHAFLDNIAHHAVPFGDHDNNPSTPSRALTPDTIGDGTLNDTADDGDPATYDDELLNAHLITGDGRGNENIALTAVHTVFHSEHNRLAAEIPGLIDALLTPAEATAWRAVDPASGWDFGERVFQAAKFVTEMEYQHLVFEEFARKLVPTINEFQPDGINFQSDTNPAIVAEFAHAAYRLGHSMLTDTIARTYSNADGTVTHDDISLIEGFLNPRAFKRGPTGGALTAREAAGAVFQGGTRQVGQEIDEFVTEAVRSNLLGLPLDLGAINLARGRSEGLPGLNSVRRQLFLATSDSSLTPYQSWTDFKFALRNTQSLVNFIAAYGNHPTLAGATTLEAKRAAAQALTTNAAFMFGAATDTGVENIDLWIGGLAEKIAPFGGMLGPTFNKIFELQLENLQNADRFYYLERLDGLNLLVQLEANSFAELIARNTTAKGMAADVFARPGLVFNVDVLLATPGVITDDLTTPEDESAMPDLILLPDGTLRYIGPEHVIWNGGTSGDHLHSSEGDDTMRGSGGNDVMEGGSGNDQFLGGDGNDILLDTFGEDVIKGGPGNDAISGGAGPFDLLQGNEGHDFVVSGVDASEVFGGSGNDIIYTGDGATESFGGGGDDWLEAGNQLNLLVGDENNQFQNDPNGGHDVITGGKGDDDFDMEGGDDIMVAGVLGTDRLEGMLGFDWVTYRGDAMPVDADMLVTGLLEVTPNLNELRDRFDLTEGLSGWRFDDKLRGDNRPHLGEDGLPDAVEQGHTLTAAGSARIAGLRTILGGQTTFAFGNILLGGAGSDILEGRGANDIIDGDAWLNVQLEGPDPLNGGTKRANSLQAFRTDIFAGRIDPGSIVIVRSIETTGATAADVDTAVFSGPAAEYEITPNANGSVTVTHDGGAGIDGTDIVRNVERLQFADASMLIASNVSATVPPVEGVSRAVAIDRINTAGVSVGAITFESSTAPAGTVIRQSPAAGGIVPALSPVDLVVSLGGTNVVVPAVLGQSAADARAVLQAAGLIVDAQVKTEESETVAATLAIRTEPAVDSIVVRGSTVTLVMSLGSENVQVPSVVGETLELAETLITNAGLRVGAVTEQESDVAAGVVISQTPEPESSALRNSLVSLVVSSGPALVLVPDVVGDEAGAAAAEIGAAGLTAAITEVNDAAVAGTVISQEPAGGASAASGSTVTLVVSLGPANVSVPDVVGDLRAAAETTITGAGLAVAVTEVNHATAPVGTVISQSPGATESVALGTLVTLTVSLGPAAPPPPAGLVLSLSFDEANGATALDASGGSRHGAIAGAARVPGKVGGALSFDGVNDSVTIPDSAALDLTTGMTISAWVNPATMDGWETIVLKERGAEALSYALYAQDGGTGAGGSNEPAGTVNIGGTDQKVLGSVLTPNTWSHLATTYDGANLRIYVNGGLVNTLAVTGDISVGDGAVRIGGNDAWAGEYFRGVIDEVRIYNRALSSDEVSAEAGVTAPAPPTGLVLALGFDTAGDAADVSGNGHGGVISGATFAATGRFGGALAFDGVDDWVTVADAAALNLGTGMTLEAWVNPNALGGWNTVILKERADGLVYSLYANEDGDRPAGYALFGTTELPVSGIGGALPLDEWSHVAVTYDGAVMTLYVNGLAVGTRDQAGSIGTAAGVLRIGGNSIWGEFFSGLIDEVRVYNRALSETEIQADRDRPVR